jgi:hypothetical protein
MVFEVTKARSGRSIEILIFLIKRLLVGAFIN